MSLRAQIHLFWGAMGGGLRHTVAHSCTILARALRGAFEITYASVQRDRTSYWTATARAHGQLSGTECMEDVHIMITISRSFALYAPSMNR